MGSALIALLPFVPKAIVDIIRAVAELKASGASDADIAALLQSLSGSIFAQDADAIAVLARFPGPTK